MKIIRAVAVFCEDLREIGKGQDILIGTMSDNLGVPIVPAMLPKLAVYLRGYFDVAAKPQPINGWVKFPWGHRIDLGEATEELVESAIRQAKAHKNPLAGVILKGMFSPFAVESFGVATAHIKIGRQEHLCGLLNFVEAPKKANVSAPPA